MEMDVDFYCKWELGNVEPKKAGYSHDLRTALADRLILNVIGFVCKRIIKYQYAGQNEKWWSNGHAARS